MSQDDIVPRDVATHMCNPVDKKIDLNYYTSVDKIEKGAIIIKDGEL